jgi:hypothetical protein
MTSSRHTGRSPFTSSTSSSNHRRAVALLAVLASLALLAGCGGGSSKTASTPTPAATTSASRRTAGTVTAQAAPTTAPQPASSNSGEESGPQMAHETVAAFAHAMGAHEFERACSLLTPGSSAQAMSAEPHAKNCAEAISDAYAELQQEEKSSHQQGFSPSDFADAKIEEEEGESFTLTAPNGQKKQLAAIWENGRGPWRVSTDSEEDQ